MSPRPARIGAAAAMAVGVALASVGGAALLDSAAEDATPGGSAVGVLDRADGAAPASPPFPTLTETVLRVGDTRVRVVIADDDAERTRGLRERSDLGDYEGMLFVFDARTESAFTMSTVPVALDIGFYDASGRVVDRLRMEPCAGSEADCPVYRASGPYRLALETLAGDLPRGDLTG